MRRNRFSSAALLTLVVSACAFATISLAEPAPEAPSLPPGMKLPEGWTEADMMACMLASTPGKMQKLLTDGAGDWTGTNTLWMAPGSEGVPTKCSAKITPILDGRFTKMEFSGEMPGMGPYSGFGLYGFDNVSQKFVGIWIDNHGTGMMNGLGTLSEDGTTINWDFNFNCPVTKAPAKMRQIEKIGSNTRTIDMFGPEPKSGVEYQIMKLELTRG